MFVGHYGVSFALKRRDATLPLWILFLAVQLLDVAWAPFVLLGIEKVRIVPGITRSNPFDLYYVPFTHSLVAAILWAIGAAALYRLASPRSTAGSSTLLGMAVFSHWPLDFLVHRPDLPIYDNAAKVGLGLWNLPALAFGLEGVLLLGGIALCIHAQLLRGTLSIVFGAVMLAIQAYVFFGPPPVSASAAAWTALVSYAMFAAVIHLLEKRAALRLSPASG
jgi:hypothetical protein